MARGQIRIGMNGRFFENNWRPALDEIAFAASAGFKAMQFPGKEQGLSAVHLGAPFTEIAAALREANISPVMEMPIQIGLDKRSKGGFTPLEILHANLEAITTLGIPAAHWHLGVLPGITDRDAINQLEIELLPMLKGAVSIAEAGGFKFGLEHNEPDERLFNTTAAIESTLDAVPGLWLVWDFNHSGPGQIEAFKGMIPRMSMLHVSDTVLPETNYHLPLGMGNVDFADYCGALLAAGFDGAAILEIGGLPKSGGYGRDTNEALSQSNRYLARIIANYAGD